MGKSPSCLEYLGNTCINVCIYCTEITAQVSRVVASIQYVTVLSTVFEQKQTCRLHRNRGSLAQSTFFFDKSFNLGSSENLLYLLLLARER